jgi:hypothetical protein
MNIIFKQFDKIALSFARWALSLKSKSPRRIAGILLLMTID